jgi:hypothetical protein
MRTLLCIAASTATVLLLPWPASASAGEGEIILLREVPPRIAYREATPGPVISKVNASPRQQVINALDGTTAGRELSDDEFAQVGTGKPALGGDGPISTLPAALGSAGLNLGGGTIAGGASANLGGMNALIGAGAGAVGQATQGIGRTVNGMLGSMPAGVTQ